MTPGVFAVAVWEDGYGAHQARCMVPGCGWRGRWHERGCIELREERARADAKRHGAEHAEEFDRDERSIPADER